MIATGGTTYPATQRGRNDYMAIVALQGIERHGFAFTA
jgi:hypothetical protein